MGNIWERISGYISPVPSTILLFSNWDTYRTQIQLLSILDPEVASDIVISHQLFAEEAGGAFPRWVMANIETGVMQGDPTPILISNAYAFGARNYDPKPIFKTMRKGAEEPGAMSQEVEARPGLKQYLDKGYYNASIQLEYTSADFAIAQFALHAVGDEFASWRYFHFARSWKNLYNPETGWLQSRNPDGSWKPLTEDFRESTYKNYFWMVPYDIAGLIEIIGGKAAAENVWMNSLLVWMPVIMMPGSLPAMNRASTFPGYTTGSELPIKHRRLLTVY